MSSICTSAYEPFISPPLFFGYKRSIQFRIRCGKSQISSGGTSINSRYESYRNRNATANVIVFGHSNAVRRSGWSGRPVFCAIIQRSENAGVFTSFLFHPLVHSWCYRHHKESVVPQSVAVDNSQRTSYALYICRLHKYLMQQHTIQTRD